MKRAFLGLTVLAFILVYAFTSPINTLKIKGVSYSAPPGKTDSIIFKDMKTRTNSNFVSIIPFAMLRQGQLTFNNPRQWRGERDEGVIESIIAARKNNLQVMVKPQIWIVNGGFTGDIELDTGKWKNLKREYENYIIHFAEISEQFGVNIFSIGNELKSFVKHDPEYWQDLIKKVRSVYTGKLTFSANWDNYRNIPFWKDLDLIGINAYFPLSEERTPSTEVLKTSWAPIVKEIDKLSKRVDIPVVFTEYGYRNIDFNCSKPWESYSKVNQNDSAQQVALHVITSVMKSTECILGGFLWKWRIHSEGNWETPNNFLIQNKPSEKTILGAYN